MAEQALWYLENIDVKSIFCPRKMHLSDGSIQKRRYNRNEYVYLQEEDADKIYLLTEGKVKIGTYTDAEKQITKAILTAGEVFGGLALMQEARRRDFAYAMDQVSVCILTAVEMRRLMREHHGVNGFFMRLLGSRSLEMERRLEFLVFKDARSRIIELVSDIARKRGQRIGDDYVVRNFNTHSDIASLTATSCQTVTSVMNELLHQNIIEFNRKQLLIHDIGQLK